MHRTQTRGNWSFAVTAVDEATDSQTVARLIEAPEFGRVFSDHMVSARHVRDRGWFDLQLGPRGSILSDPAMQVFHYGQSIFEGLKAYRHPDGRVALFRPDANARRFRASARRMAMPEVPDDLFLAAVEALADADASWISEAHGASLYLRPVLMATGVQLGMRPSDEYLFYVIASPAGSYFRTEAPAISLWVTQDHVRAAPGGTGEAKCSGNYAASMAAQAEALREGCDQVVFLDAIERHWVEELGAMNVFFVFDDDTLQTPPLAGTVLNGVTRSSLIELARECGYVVREERYSITQWLKDAANGRLREAFACGTAAVVMPVGRIKGRGFEQAFGYGSAGPVTQRLSTALLGIQQGRVPDRHGWMRPVGRSA